MSDNKYDGKIFGSDSGAVVSSLTELLDAGDKFVRSQQWVDASRVYCQVVERYPHDYRGYYGLLVVQTGNFTVRERDNRRPLEDYNRVMALAPENVRARVENQYLTWQEKSFELYEESKRAEQQKEEEAREKYIRIPCRIYKIILFLTWCVFFLNAGYAGYVHGENMDFFTPVFWISLIAGIVLAVGRKSFEEKCDSRYRDALGIVPWSN